MTKRRLLLFVSFGLLLFTGCSVDPRDQADADNSRILTDQQAAKSRAMTEQQVADEQLARSLRQDSADRFEAVFIEAFPVIVAASKIVTVALSLAISFALVGSGWGAGYAGIKLGMVAAHGAALRASQIHVDRSTRMFPLLLVYVGHGFYTLTNANTGSVVRLDTRRKEDAALVASVAEVQRVGVLAYESKGASAIPSLISQFESLVNKESYVRE